MATMKPSEALAILIQWTEGAIDDHETVMRPEDVSQGREAIRVGRKEMGLLERTGR